MKMLAGLSFAWLCRRSAAGAVLAAVLLIGAAGGACAAAPAANGSGLPLPRFAALKSGRVNMRVGPDQNKYPIIWCYRRQGLPVEIFQEYGNWRRIRDSDGAEGWVNAALLSGKRSVILAPQQKSGLLPLYSRADSRSAVAALAEPGVIGAIKQCDGTWCALDIGGNRGYIRQNLLWGVYPHEVID